MPVSAGPVITMQGNLLKQRKMKTWAWRTYWFVLEDDQFSYYKDSSRSSSRGLIDLAQAQSIRMTGAACKGFPFEIITHTRSHLLAAATAQQREQWLKQLQQARDLSARRRLSGSMHRPSCNSISEDELPPEVIRQLEGLGSQGTAQQEASSYSNDVYEDCSATGSSTQYQSPEKRLETASTAFEDDDVFSAGMVREKLNHTSVHSIESSTSTTGSISSGDVEENHRNEAMAEAHVMSSFPPIPSLPFPRMELTHRTAFDDIRLFLANNRRPDEIFATPRKSERGGKAIERLREFLQVLEEENS